MIFPLILAADRKTREREAITEAPPAAMAVRVPGR
ncbi:hypothetical protein GGI1_12350, partial [Acidithiobacillus sp. GGI-221]